MKNPKTKSLKDRAWKAFARYIKARDAGTNGMVQCCTCGVGLWWSSNTTHAGHFVHGRGSAVLFDERIVHPQCMVCNIWGKGEQGRYTLFMKKKYLLNDSQIEELLNLKHKVRKITKQEYKVIEEEYNNKADALIAIKGL